MKHFTVNDLTFLPHCKCDLQLTLTPGEALVLIGENGIGKSTLLGRLHSQLHSHEGILVPQAASDYFYDRDLKKLKEIILVAQLPRFDEDSFNYLWKAFGLEQKENRLISQLSGGESQSLKLTLALCKDVQLYFLDEPSQFLDQSRKETLRVFLRSLLKKQKSILIIEHNRDWIPKEWKLQKLEIKNDCLGLGDA